MYKEEVLIILPEYNCFSVTTSEAINSLARNRRGKTSKRAPNKSSAVKLITMSSKSSSKNNDSYDYGVGNIINRYNDSVEGGLQEDNLYVVDVPGDRSVVKGMVEVHRKTHVDELQFISNNDINSIGGNTKKVIKPTETVSFNSKADNSECTLTFGNITIVGSKDAISDIATILYKLVK